MTATPWEIYVIFHLLRESRQALVTAVAFEAPNPKPSRMGLNRHLEKRPFDVVHEHPQHVVALTTSCWAQTFPDVFPIILL